MIPEIKSMPSSYPAEKAVVSVMLQNRSMAVRAKAEGIDADCFWHPTTQVLVEAMGTLQRNDDGEADLITLVQQLADSGDLTRCGGPSEVYEVYSYSPSASGWAAWTDTLREMKARRLAISASTSLSEAVDSGEAILAAKTALEALQRAVTGQRRSINAKQASAEFVEQYEANYRAGEIAGMTTGIECLDLICGGLRAGELWVIGGKPSRGKSVLMLQIAAEAISGGKSVAVFSLEMMAHEVIGRLVSTTSRLDYGVITQPRTANKTQLGVLKETIGRIAAAPLWIDSTSNQTIETIVAESERIRDMHGSLDLVVVDYLQLIRGNRGKNESREEEVARVSGSLKQLAKLLKCPVLSATQLNEANQTRESRAIEQDADALLYICDDGIKIGKLRNGRRDDVLPLLLDGRIQRFSIIRSS